MTFTNIDRMSFDVHHSIVSEEHAVDVFHEQVVEYLYWEVKLKSFKIKNIISNMLDK